MNIQFNDRVGAPAESYRGRRSRRWWMSGRVAFAVVAITLGPGLTPALASQPSSHHAIGDVSVFATVPAPGHPFGIAVDRNRIYVSTSAGDFFAPTRTPTASACSPIPGAASSSGPRPSRR